MEQHRKDIQKEKSASALQILEKLHPHKVYLYVGMLCCTFILFSMLIAYMVTKPEGVVIYQYYIPKTFILSSFILGLSAYSISRILPLYRRDDLKGVSKHLGLSLVYGLVFSVLQFAGYQKLTEMGVYVDSQAATSYLFVISAIHGLLLVGGLFALMVSYYNTLKNSRDVVKTLIMVTTPYQKIKLEMLVSFWLFVNISWSALFLFFLFLY
jgi:cytochrome c oxidase subunit III